MALSLFSLVILLILLVLSTTAILLLAGLPGKIAKDRRHPQFEAIKVCGWLGILTGGLLWILALIWAYTKSSLELSEREKMR